MSQATELASIRKCDHSFESYLIIIPQARVRFKMVGRNKNAILVCIGSVLPQLTSVNRRPVGSVGRVPDYRAGGRGFKPRSDQHSGSLNN